MHLLSCGSNEAKGQNLQHRNFGLKKFGGQKWRRTLNNFSTTLILGRQEGKRANPRDPVRNGRSIYLEVESQQFYSKIYKETQPLQIDVNITMKATTNTNTKLHFSSLNTRV